MTEVVILALIAQAGTLLSLLITLLVKVKKVEQLVNGHSHTQQKLIERQSEQIASLGNSLSKKG